MAQNAAQSGSRPNVFPNVIRVTAERANKVGCNHINTHRFRIPYIYFEYPAMSSRTRKIVLAG